MAILSEDVPSQLKELVAYLFARREAILNSWRTACEQDPTLAKVSSLSREEFNNLLPIILDILEQRLLNQKPQADTAVTASSHGLHRWQKAMHLSETLQELHHLTQILYGQLQSFQDLFPDIDSRLLLRVHQQITQLMSETINGSVHKYDELQRLEAANRANALQQAINQMETISRQRGDMLRTSSHDLRSSFGIVNSAAYLLKSEGLSEQERDQYLNMLNRNLTNIQSMLGNLMDLSRLEAGEETLRIETVDVAELLRGLVLSAQPIATERGLVLQADGPDSLVAETDSVKLQRIAQNLLLNALKYTTAGFISVSWAKENDTRFIISIQDSGPGLPNNLTNMLAQQLKPTVEPTSATSPDQAEPVSVYPDNKHEVPPGDRLVQQTSQPDQGEGVGLQIVKRLCDLLNANMEIETQPERGTLVRLRIPLHWEERTNPS